MIHSQVELEHELAVGGRERALRMMAKNEEQGRANSNAYASPVFRRFVQPLAEQIEVDLEPAAGAGRHKAHVGYLRSLEPVTSAYIAVRGVLVHLLEGSGNNGGKELCSRIGGLVQSELVMRQLANIDQDKAFFLQQELARRQSVSVRQRRTLAIRTIKELDGTPIDWGAGSRLQVGAYLLENLRNYGMIEMWHHKVKKGKGFYVETNVKLTPEVMDLIQEIREVVAESMPFFAPCVEQPLDWNTPHDGGFHTPEMKYFTPTAIRGGNKAGGDVTNLLQAINALQAVKWKINTDVLEAMKAVARVTETEELVSAEPPAQPSKPSFLVPDLDKDTLTEDQKREFKTWRRAMAEWHTQLKLKGQKYGRMYTALRIAEKFKDNPELHFVYGADFRGRFYPSTSGVSPQGSDMQKSLLTFAEGKPLATQEARDWFLIHGANKFGVDKVPFAERIQWVKDNHDHIIQFANDPAGYRDWLNADKPFQFLAWCIEYRDFCTYGRAFSSHLPLGQDGSCNGLQNFSAMLRDGDGGRATNLIPHTAPNDIYGDVAHVTTKKLQALSDEPMAALWLAHGINRKVVKRSVMTLPYGSTRHSCREFILVDYLRGENVEDIPREVHVEAAGYLAGIVWDSISEVVVKARLAMDWLQACSSIIMATGADVIRWDTPSGFVAQQDYMEWEKAGEVRVSLFGGARWSLYRGEDKPNKREHRNGIAPNFIHSLDAAHMQAVAIQCRAEGINALAMIHDDFGTHAADTARFHEIIRETFVEMYERENWLEKFYLRYKNQGIDLPEPPAVGYLDIKCVLNSPYFFA